MSSSLCAGSVARVTAAARVNVSSATRRVPARLTAPPRPPGTLTPAPGSCMGRRARRRPQKMKAVERGAQSTAPAGLLSDEQRRRFLRDGFLVLEDFATREEVESLKRRMEELVEGFEPADVVSVFSTVNQRRTTDDYFFDSAADVSFFFEEKAFDEAGELVKPKHLAINKVGHALHDKDPVFREFSRSPKMAALAASLGFRRPLPVQSMYIFKQPQIGGEVVAHQDSTFLYTSPLSCIGVWLAIEDATKENGCLWATTHHHREGVSRRMIVNGDRQIEFDKPPVDYDLSEFQALEMRAGSLVVLHGENVHYSSPNTSNTSRHAYSMHMVEGAEGVVWAPDNWAQRGKDDPWEPLYEE